jgi:hypothetical protein
MLRSELAIDDLVQTFHILFVPFIVTILIFSNPDNHFITCSVDTDKKEKVQSF